MRRDHTLAATLAALVGASALVVLPALVQAGCASSASDCDLLGTCDDALYAGGGGSSTTTTVSTTASAGGGGAGGAGGSTSSTSGTTSSTSSGGGDCPTAQRFGNPSEQSAGLAALVGADLYVAGAMLGSLSFPGGSQLDAGEAGTYVAKLDPVTLEQAWGHVYADAFLAATTLSDGGVVLAGFLGSSGGSGGGGGLQGVPGGFFLRRLDAVGAEVWTHTFQLDLSAGGEVHLATDAADRVAVVGAVSGTMQFDVARAPQGGLDAFAALVGADGKPIASVRLGGPGDERFAGAVFDATSRLYVAGEHAEPLDVGGGIALDNGVGADVFVVRYGSSLAVQSAWAMKGGGTQAVDAVALGPSDHVVLATRTDADVDLLGTTLPASGPSLVVAELDLSSAAALVVSTGVYPFTGRVHGLTVSDGRVALAGELSGPATFGATGLASAGGTDLLLAVLDESAGSYAPTWAASYGDATDGQRAVSVALDQGALIVAGDLVGSVDLGTGAPLTATGGTDLLLARVCAP